MNIPTFSILIVNYNGKQHLEECLGSVYGQSFKDFEVVMVDNASADGSVEWVKERFPEVKVVVSRTNLGFAGGNNLGLPHCSGRWIFFLNNDTRIAPDALAELDAHAKSAPKTRVFACFLLNYKDPSKVDSAGDTIYTWGPTFSWTGYPAAKFTSPRQVTSACAGAAVYHRDVLDRIGGFDEDFFLNFEDVDLSLRARHAGENILFLPSVKVYHKGSASLGGKKSRTSLFYSERNFLAMVLKNFPLPNLIRFLPALLFIKAGSLRTCVKYGCAEAWFKANLEALRLLPGMLAKRRAIQETSVLGGREFARLLRKSWLRERLAFHRGEYDIPI